MAVLFDHTTYTQNQTLLSMNHSNIPSYGMGRPGITGDGTGALVGSLGVTGGTTNPLVLGGVRGGWFGAGIPGCNGGTAGCSGTGTTGGCGGVVGGITGG